MPFDINSFVTVLESVLTADHSIHMSSVLQAQQLFTAGIPLLEAYLLLMANNPTRKERRSQEQNGR